MSELYDASTPHPLGHRDARPEQVFADRGRTRVVDVREPPEFHDELGHIEGAALVPLAGVGLAARGWDRDQAIVFVCRSGRRSEQAAAQLTAAGFRRVMNMVGGMLAWNAARLPIQSATDVR